MFGWYILELSYVDRKSASESLVHRRSWVRIRRGIFVLCGILLFVFPIIAQSPNGTVSGLVVDASGGVIVGADVTIVNDATRVQYSSKTNSEGIYVVPNLQPGQYRLQVSKVGFKTLIKPDIILNVQDALAINFTLPIGAASETVTVTGGASLLNTESPAVSTVVDRQFAENLPLNGRSFQTLILLTPGVVVTPSNVLDSGQFSVNGQRGSSNYWTVDGVSANIGIGVLDPGNGFGGTLGAFSALGGTNSIVSVDAMQEFRIQTSTYAPEFGRTPGAQISIVTRSGTNQFHGTAFDYLRNDALDANDWFADSAGLAKPAERQNDFGGTLGGPIVRDRTFFFFSYEGLRLALPQTALTTVPDASFTPGGTTNSRQNAIPAMQPFLNAFPLPNRNSPELFMQCNPATDPTCPPSGLKATGTAQFNASFPDAGSLDAYSLRLDHKLGNKVTLFGRYNYSPSELRQRGPGADALSVVNPIRITTQTGTVGATWAISSTVANDLRFNYSRTSSLSDRFLDGFGGAIPLASPPFPDGFSGENAHFSLEIRSLTLGPELETGHNAQNLQRQINVLDNLSVQRGSHDLKFGVDFRRLTPQTAPAQYSQSVMFSNLESSQAGNSSIGFVFSDAAVTLQFRNLGLFAQDTWRVVPRLVLTYGLRWDVDFAPSSLNGPAIPAVTGFNLNDLSHLTIAPPGTPPFKTPYGNVAPRVGLAYQLTQNQNWGTVLRGGFGVFYDLASSETGAAVVGVPPFGAFNVIVGGAFPYSPGQSAPVPIPTTGSIAELVAFNPELKLPYTLEWNIAVEQGLGKDQTISATYIGAAGRRLLQTAVVTSPSTNPAIQSGSFIDNFATSDYDALQVQFQRRLSAGLQALASYSWSHSIDTGSAGSPQLASNAAPLGSSQNGNRGPSDFDIRNAFSGGVTYDIPKPKVNRLARAILADWSLQSFILARSAPPVDASDGNFFEFNGGVEADVRPDLVPGQPLYLFGTHCASVFQAMGALAPGASCPGGKGFNPNAFTDPPVDPNTGNPLRQGNVPRNFLRAFGAWQWDFAVHRDFRLHDAVRLQFRAEMFNVLNHPNFGPPSGAFGFGGFGLSTQMLGRSLNGGSTGQSNLGGGAFDSLYQIGGPRSVQLALKLIF
jgi:hypothetical protein